MPDQVPAVIEPPCKFFRLLAMAQRPSQTGNHSNTYDEDSRLRIASFFNAFGWESQKKAPWQQPPPPPPERAPKIEENIAEFDASIPVWQDRIAKIESDTISLLDNAVDPPKIISQYPLSKITKIGSYSSTFPNTYFSHKFLTAIPRKRIKKQAIVLAIFVDGFSAPVEVAVRKHTLFLLEVMRSISSKFMNVILRFSVAV